MQGKRKYALSIAGYDPSAGAGVLADIKTFEAHKILGLAVCSSQSVQNEVVCKKITWQKFSLIQEQIDILFEKHKIKYCKIGLIESQEMLEQTVNRLLWHNKNIKIIFDPILSTSSGYNIHSSFSIDSLSEVLKKIYLFTPNYDEMKILAQSSDIEGAFMEKISKTVNVFLKGGHNPNTPYKDYLYTNKKEYPFRARTVSKYPKHGSGCVLSAAITANLAKGFPLIKACLKAKQYTEWHINSNATLLGYHKF